MDFRYWDSNAFLGWLAEETEERALVYVAATRAKKELLLVLSFGTPSRLLQRSCRSAYSGGHQCSTT